MTIRRNFDEFMRLDVDGAVLEKVQDMERYIYREIVKSAAVGTNERNKYGKGKDYKGGAFRANINRSKGTPDPSFNKNKTSSIEGRSPVDDPYATYHVSSAAPYATTLEYGRPKGKRWTLKQPLGLFNLVGHAASLKFR